MTEMSPTAASPLRPQQVGEVVVAPEGQFTERAAAHVAALLREAAERRSGPISVALAGGNTPRPVYASLAAMRDIAWDRLEIFFGDERAVPPDDAQSNYAMARASLLDRVPVAEDRVHRMRAEDESPERAARAYARELPAALDVLLLGIGANGHTASLFPESDALRARELVVPAMGPAAPRARLTVTPPVLAAARRIAVLASGTEKAAAVSRALMGAWNPEGCPAQLARRGVWLLDEASASELPGDLRGRTGAPAEDSA